ncbi:hypothetical protein O0L34_g17783 [Tuta absoluta]|nr:hypothetical protein O0L34_g17783 [Tuta absoluta]
MMKKLTFLILLLIIKAQNDAPASTEGPGCGLDEWQCEDRSRCVPAAWRCDGRPHCTDGSDELHCFSCGVDEWQCEDRSRCVALRRPAGLHGSSDVLHCFMLPGKNVTCSPGQFKCSRSGICIAESWRCDGDPDCGPQDTSDEDPFMCEKNFKCPGNEARCATPIRGYFSCVPIEKFCDGKRDCIDKSDEWDFCDNFTSAQCSSLGCKEGCRPTNEGLSCYCRTGYEPLNGTCVDSDECQREDACTQTCQNTVGSFKCGCVDGYYLMADKWTCRAYDTPKKPLQPPPLKPVELLLVTQSQVRHLQVDSTQDTLVDNNKQDKNKRLQALGVRAIHYLYSNNTVCYVHHNVSKSGIMCADVDNMTQRRTLPTPALFPDVDSVTHLAIDWISLNWYLVDEVRESIYVCEHSLQSCRLLIDSKIDKAYGFALDPTQGYMFWTVWGAVPPAVNRADLAGENLKSLASLKLVYPSALTLDLANKMVYWADTYLECIERADYDGNKRLTIRRNYITQHLHHISIFETTLYLPKWGNVNNGSISMVPRFSRRKEQLTMNMSPTELELDSRPSSVLVYHKQAQPLVNHPCAVNKGGCAHICVTAYDGGKPRAHCICRHGYRLAGLKDCVRAQLDSYLIVARGSPPLVQALGIDKGSHSTWEAIAPATDTARPTAADVDLAGEYLYYCDVHRYNIFRQKLDGTGREVFADHQVDNCEGVAVDWMGGNLYWTDDALGTVSVARLDKPSVRRALIQAANFNPRSIAIDPANGMMYWSVWASAVAAKGRIEAARMDASARHTLLDTDLHWPNGLAINYEENVLYWCDTYLNKIERMSLPSGKRELVAQHSDQHPLMKPYGLALYEGTVIWSEHATGLIKKLQKGNITVVHTLPPPLYDLKLISNTQRIGKNKCSFNNGDCEELCLATGGSRVCGCADERTLTADNKTCAVGRDPPPVCPDSRFHCGRGRCIDAQYVCDGDEDCPDGSDEDASPTGPCANATCSEDQYMQCDKNRCIPKSWVCDGLKDCTDGADESTGACAKVACGADQFACALSRRCIPIAWRCDGARDCGRDDPSDERDCRNLECSDSMFRCTNGACLPWEYYCDGHADCADASDERACRAAPPSPSPAPPRRPPNALHPHRDAARLCEPHEYQCADTECIRMVSYCDERACRAAPPSPSPAPPRRPPNALHPHRDAARLCEPHEYQCADTECIRMEFRCDSRVDCIDGSDEADCESVPTSTTPVATTTTIPEHECAKPAVRCDNNTRCVPLLQLCDGNLDCSDGADEADRCGEPMCLVSPCSHICHPAPSGPVCSCPASLHLQRDGHVCNQRHVCTEWGVCSQTCKPQKNKHKCTCYEGFQLADDGFTCKSTDKAVPLLVFSNRHEIRGVELPSLASRALISSLKNTIALDWRRDPATGSVDLYWTDVVDDNIYKGTIVGNALSGIEVVVQQGLSTAEGLAVDWVAGNLYWVESSLHQIEVARLDGQYRRTLIAGDMDSPRAIAVDPNVGYLFWSDWEQSWPRIERCSLSGRRRTAVVRVDALTDGAWPNGIALDHLAKRLYWIDARSDSIHTTSYDGTDYHEVLQGHAALSHPFAITVFESHVYCGRHYTVPYSPLSDSIHTTSYDGTDYHEVLQGHAVLSHPFAITVSDSIHTTSYDGTDYHEVLQGHAALSHPFAITVFESHVYWTDWRSNSVVRANKWNGSDVAVVQRTLTQPFDIKVIHPSRQPAARVNPCGINNGNCSHLCLIDGPAERVCACPHVMRLATDNITCEAHEKVLLYGRPGEIRGVDLDEPNIHIIPTVSGPHLTSPAVIQIYAKESSLFWADTETNEIKRIGLTGGPVRVLADSGVDTPRGFALDWAAGLLYYSTGSSLAVSNLAGEYTALLATDTTNLTSLAVDPLRGKLYWSATPHSGEKIETANCDGTGRKLLVDTHKDRMLAGVTSMTVDVTNNLLYWVNIHTASIQYLNLRNGKVTTLTLSVGARPVALDYYNGQVIWADGEERTIRACSDTACSQPRLLRNNTDGVISLRVYDAHIQNKVTGACALRRTPCAHLCLPVSQLDSVCRCATGYTPMGPKCKAVDEVLVYSGSWEIRGLSLTEDKDARNVLPPIAQLSMASAIDYHAEGEWLYWADSEAGAIWRVKRDGTNRQLLLHQADPPLAPPNDCLAGLAIDWVGGNMYWSDPRRNLVEVARLDAQHRYVLLDTDPFAVTTLAVDGIRGWLFLAGGGWIQRARLDGSQRELLYNGTALADIAIDTQNEYVYWADTWDGSVWRMRYTGADKTQLLVGPKTHPAAIAVYGGMLYWGDTMLNRGSIVKAPLTNLSDYTILKDNAGDSIKDIFIWSTALQTLPAHNASLAASPCASNNGGCAALCLFNGNGKRCACPHGDTATDGNNCTRE